MKWKVYCKKCKFIRYYEELPYGHNLLSCPTCHKKPMFMFVGKVETDPTVINLSEKIDLLMNYLGIHFVSDGQDIRISMGKK